MLQCTTQIHDIAPSRRSHVATCVVGKPNLVLIFSVQLLIGICARISYYQSQHPSIDLVKSKMHPMYCFSVLLLMLVNFYGRDRVVVENLEETPFD